MTGKEKLIQMLQDNPQEFIKCISSGSGCPDDMDLDSNSIYNCENDKYHNCADCWTLALDQELSE